MLTPHSISVWRLVDGALNDMGDRDGSATFAPEKPSSSSLPSCTCSRENILLLLGPFINEVQGVLAMFGAKITEVFAYHGVFYSLPPLYCKFGVISLIFYFVQKS